MNKRLILASNIEKMKKSILSILVSIIPLVVNADPVEINGIWYNLISKVKQAEVTSMPSGNYSGEIVIPAKVNYDGVQYDVTSIGFGAFTFSKITSISIPNSVTTIGNAAFQHSDLRSIDIPQSVTDIGSNAFLYCDEMSSFIIPNSITTIKNSTFSGCSSLKSIIIPSNVTVIEGSAFSLCSGLSSITIPNNVKSIENNAFEACTSLQTITIGENVNSIGSKAFSGCTEITDVYCQVVNLRGDRWDSSNDLFAYDNVFEGSYVDYVTLHVPEESIETYKNIAPWSGFKDIVAISDGEIPEKPKCATPTVTYTDGKITLSCETDGVEYVSTISAGDAKSYYDGEITLTNKYTVSVRATKTGYDDSDTATLDIVGSAGAFGDLNEDGVVNVADHVELSKIIMNQK